MASLLKSAYEVAREERIRRNAEVMQSLGLDTSAPSAAASGSSSSSSKQQQQQQQQPKPKQEPTRQSKRMRGLGPDGEQVNETKKKQSRKEEEEDDEDDDDGAMQRRIDRLKCLHQENNSAYKNPTATYEHTWMRVKTMSDKALATRVKVIERCAGQHCLVKMRMFAEVLLLADKEELAKLAEEALGRLMTEAGIDPSTSTTTTTIEKEVKEEATTG